MASASLDLGLCLGDTRCFDTPSFCPHFYLVLARKTDIFKDFLNGGSKEGVSPKHRPNYLFALLLQKILAPTLEIPSVMDQLAVTLSI